MLSSMDTMRKRRCLPREEELSRASRVPPSRRTARCVHLASPGASLAYGHAAFHSDPPPPEPQPPAAAAICQFQRSREPPPDVLPAGAWPAISLSCALSVEGRTGGLGTAAVWERQPIADPRCDSLDPPFPEFGWRHGL